MNYLQIYVFSCRSQENGTKVFYTVTHFVICDKICKFALYTITSK